MDDLVHHVPRQIHWNGESDTLVAAGPAEDGGVDANQFALGVDERAARITWVNRGVGLDEVLVFFDSQSSTAGGGRPSEPGRSPEDYAAAAAISIFFALALSVFGSVIVRTPSLKSARILSASTLVGRLNDRQNDPYNRSIRW